VLRSPWLGALAILIAGVIGYVLADGQDGSESTLASVTVTIRPTRDTGAAWDFGGGMPDPKTTVMQGETVLASCETKDTLKPTCAVAKTIDRGQGPVRVVVVDADASDDDLIGELVIDLGVVTTTGTGAVQAVDVAATASGAGAWERLRALWIALAIGVSIAIALALYRRRHA